MLGMPPGKYKLRVNGEVVSEFEIREDGTAQTVGDHRAD